MEQQCRVNDADNLTYHPLETASASATDNDDDNQEQSHYNTTNNNNNTATSTAPWMRSMDQNPINSNNSNNNHLSTTATATAPRMDYDGAEEDGQTRNNNNNSSSNDNNNRSTMMNRLYRWSKTARRVWKEIMTRDVQEEHEILQRRRQVAQQQQQQQHRQRSRSRNRHARSASWGSLQSSSMGTHQGSELFLLHDEDDNNDYDDEDDAENDDLAADPSHPNLRRRSYNRGLEEPLLLRQDHFEHNSHTPNNNRLDTAEEPPPPPSPLRQRLPSQGGGGGGGPLLSPATRHYLRNLIRRAGNYLAYCTLLCMLCVVPTVVYNQGFKRHHLDSAAFRSAGVMATGTVILSFRLVYLHLSHWYMPSVQKYVVRILWMVPLYAVQSWLSLRFKDSRLYIDTLRDYYEAFVIASFVYYLMELLGGQDALVQILIAKAHANRSPVTAEENDPEQPPSPQRNVHDNFDNTDSGNNTTVLPLEMCERDALVTESHLSQPPPRQQESATQQDDNQHENTNGDDEEEDNNPYRHLGRHSFPFSLILEEWEMGEEFMLNCKHGVLQYVVFKSISAFIVFVCESNGVYGEGKFDWFVAYPYLCFFQNVSVMYALYCLVLLFSAVSDELRYPINWRPLGKFLCIKGVIFFTWWQGVVIFYLKAHGFITEMGSWSSEQVANGLIDYCVVIEMVGFAMAHAYTFTYQEYLPSAIPLEFRTASTTTTTAAMTAAATSPALGCDGDTYTAATSPFDKQQQQQVPIARATVAATNSGHSDQPYAKVLGVLNDDDENDTNQESVLSKGAGKSNGSMERGRHGAPPPQAAFLALQRPCHSTGDLKSHESTNHDDNNMNPNDHVASSNNSLTRMTLHPEEEENSRNQHPNQALHQHLSPRGRSVLTSTYHPPATLDRPMDFRDAFWSSTVPKETLQDIQQQLLQQGGALRPRVFSLPRVGRARTRSHGGTTTAASSTTNNNGSSEGEDGNNAADSNESVTNRDRTNSSDISRQSSSEHDEAFGATIGTNTTAALNNSLTPNTNTASTTEKKAAATGPTAGSDTLAASSSSMIDMGGDRTYTSHVDSSTHNILPTESKSLDRTENDHTNPIENATTESNNLEQTDLPTTASNDDNSQPSLEGTGKKGSDDNICDQAVENLPPPPPQDEEEDSTEKRNSLLVARKNSKTFWTEKSHHGQL